MANTRGSSPYSTYHTDRIQFIGNPESRSSDLTKDQQFINFYPTLIDSPINGSKKYRLEQRAGKVFYASNVATPTGSTIGRGIYHWKTGPGDYSVVGNVLYHGNTALQTLSTSTGTVGFIEYQNITTSYLIVLDGISGWVISTSNVVTQIVSANFPAGHSVQAAFMDGYLFVIKGNTDDIYNCNLNDPFTWSAGDFVSAEMYPDKLVALTRQNNYIVAIGQKSIEYFYNTGVSPGTPLARNSAAAHQIGSPAPASVSQTEEQIIFLGQTNSGEYSIWMMDGFQPTEIGIDPVKKSINAQGSLILATTAFCARLGGHRFYILNLISTTWVYDFGTKMWHQWSGISALYSMDRGEGSPIIQDANPGNQYRLVYGVSTDDNYTLGSVSTSPMVSTATSAKLDFGNMNRKFMSRFTLVCDVPNGSNSTSCSIQWSDDDYQTWSTARTITIGDTISTITQLGSFRRRAFKLTYSQIYPLLLEGFEVDTNMGSQ